MALESTLSQTGATLTRIKQPTGILGAGRATSPGLNRIPLEQDTEEDTDPQPFGSSDNQDTAKRCYACGRDQLDTFAAGKTWTVRALRKWLATRMTASEAIAVTAEFVRKL